MKRPEQVVMGLAIAAAILILPIVWLVNWLSKAMGWVG